MRRAGPSAALLLVACALLPGCRKEPDFDAQYDETSQQIEARAKKLDAEMAQQMQAMDREVEVRGYATPTSMAPPAKTTATETTTTDRK